MFLLTMNNGLNFSFPDVCNTPAPSGTIPIPYPNLSNPSNASSAVSNIVIDGAKSLNLLSKVSSSMGDEAGTIGGVVSGSFGGPTRFLLGSFSVFLNGVPAVRMGSQTAHNGSLPNSIGTAIIPTQSSVLILG